MKRFLDWLGRYIDGRDFIAGLGVALLGYGGELLYPGAGYVAAGAVLVAVAVLVR